LDKRNNALNPNTDFNGAAHSNAQKDLYVFQRKAQARLAQSEKIIRQQKIRKG